MDTIYKTYERFIEAAKKFPRWNNTRRRPTTSVGGALLRSIIEEIGRVEDAIIEYKKDFFIVNYVNKEDKIVDYLYSAQIGNIEDLDQLVVLDPELELTTDIKEFYLDIQNKVYYQDSYLIVKNPVDKIRYAYNGFEYVVDAEKYHIWNIFDEFAWWAGIERFEDEENRALLIRTINQFRKRPNSSETGLKNVIYNALSGVSTIDLEEIKFEQPNEDNLYLLNDDGEILYEEISKFNRDIARTKRWDMDYWDNSFRSLGYIAHPWDAPVKIYQDGVGYNDSLYVSTVKDLNIDNETTVTINGYKKSSAQVEEYIKNNNLSKNIDLTLTKYNNEIKPFYVQYKIEASPLTAIDDPAQVYVDAYRTSKREISYSIDSLIESKENITVTPRNVLEPNKQYTVKILPQAESFSTMEILECKLNHSKGSTNLLTPKGSFGYNDKGLFVNKSVLFHADSVTDLNSSVNLQDYRYGGFTLIDGGLEASCTVDVTGVAENKNQPLTVSTSCELYSIISNPSYIKAEDFTIENATYISGKSTVTPSILTIELLCRDLEFNIDKATSDLASGYANIETYIDGKLDMSHSYYNVSVASFKKYSLKQYRLRNVKIVIKRNTSVPIKVSNINVSRYEVKIITSEGVDISPTTKESVTLPAYNGRYYLDITIKNYGQNRPVINCIHVGANLNILTSAYTIELDTTGLVNSELIVDSNCRVDVYLKENQKEPIDFSPYNLYTNNTLEYQAIYLDLAGFTDIYYSSPEIKYASGGKPYIQLKPGTALDIITIYGDSEILLERTSLKNIFNLGLGDKLYANKNIRAFVKTQNTDSTLLTLDYDMCSTKNADTYRVWSSKYPNLQACFVSNVIKNVESITDKYAGIFDHVYMYDKDSITYIAYNGQNVVKNLTAGISIVKNFSPVLPSNLNVLFQIVNTAKDFVVTFEDGADWSASISKKIKIEGEIDLSNTDIFNTSIRYMNENFVLSNNISLSDTYEIADEEIELARYIITPPDNMEIVYDVELISQERDEDNNVMYIEEDGFNKLLYSNILTITKVLANDKEVKPEDYTVLGPEGIICWNNDNYVGEVLKVVYTYQKPRYLVYKDISYLYDIVGYQIDTMEKVETVTDYVINHAIEGTTINIDYNYFVEKPDRIVISSSNPCYAGVVNNDTVTIKKIADDDSVVIHNGYYYIDGKEYWYFADKYIMDQERLNGIKSNNVDKLGKDLVFKEEATNYLKNSKMLCNCLNVHCITDFKNYKLVPSINSLNHVGICENFSNWYSYGMDIKFNDTYDGNVLEFKSQNESSYALLDITHALFTNKVVSCQYDGILELKIGREILISGQQISKTLYVEQFKDFSSSGSGDIVYCDCSDFDLEHYRYYLIVSGSGTLIEVMATEDPNTVKEDHVKAIDKLGFKIEESIPENALISLDFEPIGMRFNNLELAKDLTLQTGTTLDWGVTRVAEVDLTNVSTTGMLYRNDAWVAQEDGAVLSTKNITLRRPRAIQNLFIKVNDYPYENLKDFDIKVYGSNTLNGIYTEMFKVSNKNLATLGANSVTGYIKIEIIAKENKVINHLEVLALYKEGQIETADVVTNEYGYCTTKVYDVGIPARFILKEVKQDSTDEDKVRIEVRGLRIADNDNVWTNWYDIKENHEFDQYRYFQFKITINGSQVKTKLDQFILEAKG